MDSLDERVTVYLRIPRRYMKELKQVISQEFGFSGRSLISATVAKAIKEYVERHKNSEDAAHTYILENHIPENIPTSHLRSRKVKVDNEPIPVPMSTNSIVLINNGKSSGKDDFDWFEWANRMALAVEDKHIEMANKMCSDPKEAEQMFNDWINRLKAKSKRQVVSEVDKKASEISKDQAEIMKRENLRNKYS